MTTKMSRFTQGCLETMRDIHAAGGMSDAKLKECETLCLPPAPVKEYSATKIRRLRARVHVSQEALAGYLNTSIATVRQWETGTRHPSGPSLRLLTLLDTRGPEILCA